ncbi:SCD domain-containing protein [Mycena kentingensis (nom. inval.)]|nr:SCD domain-containing protein [Mycena kentingensis (nom. inval.)]
MSDATPRRTLRERKAPPPQIHDDDDDEDAPAPKASKRKRAAAGSDADDDDNDTPKRKTKRKPKDKNSPAVKKAPRKTTRRVKGAGGDAFDPQQAAKESHINADNPLYNAILNPAAALQSTAEDFLESLAETPNLALAELVNMVLRCCGCNETMDGDQAVDVDGILDTLDEVTEELKKEAATAEYPLNSKLPVFKKFRKSLREFLERLISSAAALGSLYTSSLIPTLQQWVVAMSSSQIRSVRHTATVIALELESALCDVAAKVEKEAELSARQREGEKKRRGGKGAVANDKGHDAKAAKIREQREKLDEFIKDVIDSVFIHRYRDLDPVIRTDCIEALGVWFTKFPAHFLDNHYLKYIGWVLPDAASSVRLAALHALAKVYAQPAYAPQVLHFTERFKPRLLEMAAKDVDATVRVAVIGVLEALGAAGLDDEEREQVALCVFDAEPRVRKAVGGFVRACWEEVVEDLLVGRTDKATEEEQNRAGVKALAAVMVRWGAALDEALSPDDDDNDMEVDGERRPTKMKEPGSLTSAKQADRMGRAGLAVEALWNDVEAINDWETQLDVLLLDHTSAEEADASSSRKRKTNGKASKATEEGLVDEAWRLEEDEETVLIEVLVTSLQCTKDHAKKGDEENVTNDITRALIKGLPRLLVKYQTDQARITNILMIPMIMNLDLYLEMRMLTGYASLWDDISKQFLSHADPTVLKVAAHAMSHLISATSLSNTNSTKILELEDELSSTLRDAVAGKDEIEVAGFDEDEMIALAALCQRVAVLFGLRDLSAWMEEDEGGKQSSAWDIVAALVDRGRLGYKEEAAMVGSAIEILEAHLMWKMRHLSLEKDLEDLTPDELRFRERTQEQRDALVDKISEYAVGTQSNTAPLVSRKAFISLMNVHILFGSTPMSIPMDDEMQFRCAGYVQAEIERYAENLADEVEGDDDEEEQADRSENEDGEDARKKKQKPKPKKRAIRDVDPNSPDQLLNEYSFLELAVAFMRALRSGSIGPRHAAVLLSQHGRFGSMYDNFAKVIVDLLRQEGLYGEGGGDLVVTVVTQSLQDAFTLVLDGLVPDGANAMQLAKHLAQVFVHRGAQLAVLKRLDITYVVQTQTTLLSWLAKRIAGYEKSKNNKSLGMATSFFKALGTLLVGVTSRDAMKIKAHLDQTLAQAKIDSSSTSKIWDPLRAYEKRLSNISSKDKTGTKGRKSKAAKPDGQTSSEGEDDPEMSEVEDLVRDRGESPAPVPDPKPRRAAPKPKPKPKPKKAVVEEGDDHDGSPEPATPKPKPKARPKPKAAFKNSAQPQTQTTEMSKSLSQMERQESESEPEPELENDNPDEDVDAPSPSPAPAQTPRQSQKRARPTSDDEEEGGGEDDEPAIPAPQPTPAGDMQVRRKRARH